MRLCSLLWVVVVTAGVHLSAFAQLDDITAGELSLTPAYCQDVQTMNGWSKTKPSPRTGYWIGLMGESFWTMHHYCWALIRIRRAQMPGTPPIIRKGMLQHSVSDYKFVIRNSTPDFVLLPEIYTRLGELYVLLEDYGQAVDAYERAAQLKPDYWPAYARWAELLLKANQKAQARQVVAQGLQRAPDSESLLQMYKSLGGDATEASRPSRPIAPEESAASGPTAGAGLHR